LKEVFKYMGPNSPLCVELYQDPNSLLRACLELNEISGE
jgi:hypothetical protein